MKIALGSDHAGFELKEKIKTFLEELGHEILDLGCYSKDSVDYPEFGAKVARAILNGEAERGILICGTGIGMSMVANRFHGIRAALCHELFTAKMARLHNDANILVLGGRVIGDALAFEMVKVFIDTPFEGGRHERRIKLIDELTKE
ncbi:ribose 5-phosphate isomerase B [Thermodesulfatator autotrophicus]|uniref:Ribose-5-phosphate isomerase n=1 Tax=Thermodesulfatator autotrophicus TaxID=1795632 RepID=A0A177E4S4_9BACT|nr:ribose 5-phosphate isomerase B [Thermodesulfatator autotrophicus]OAG26967.1 ribose-5-phosphate isomerase [Thermodesulfatator autotrophicus]